MNGKSVQFHGYNHDVQVQYSRLNLQQQKEVQSFGTSFATFCASVIESSEAHFERIKEYLNIPGTNMNLRAWGLNGTVVSSMLAEMNSIPNAVTG